MHYIRFLKSPKLRQEGTTRYIDATLTLTTDLGDNFYSQDVGLDIVCSINGDTSTDQLAQCSVQWRAGMRLLPIELKIKPLSKVMPCFVEVKAKDLLLDQVHFVENTMHTPVIISARTEVIVGPRGPEGGNMLLRTVDLRSCGKLLIWEEAGDSIARHVWDAGMAAVSLLSDSQQLAKNLPRIGKLLGERDGSMLKVIELGTGTGLTGLALAKAFPLTSVLVTDVAEVKALVDRNIEANKTASRSSVRFQALDWSDQVLPATAEQCYDLIIASDVTYNPDSGEALVGTIATIAASSPAALILIAMKKRHASEDVFFNLMAESRFKVIEKTGVLAPAGLEEDNIETAERLELFVFQWQ